VDSNVLTRSVEVHTRANFRFNKDNYFYLKNLKRPDLQVVRMDKELFEKWTELWNEELLE
jgi:hypothetical protein